MWTTLALTLVLAAAVGAAGFPPDVTKALETTDHIYVATRRADGSRSSAAPVWFMYDGGDAVYFTTAPDSHKVRRIRKGSPVFVAVGTKDGPAFEGRAELLADTALAARMGEHYSQKYWIAWMGLFRPRASRVGAGKTVIVKVTPAS
jgi:PPOX class probable F420-dependent enzyme